MLITIAVIALSQISSEGSGAAVGDSAVTGAGAVVELPADPVRPCPDNRRGLRYYRAQRASWDRKLGVKPPSRLERGRSCERVRELLVVAKRNARLARERYEAWRTYHYAWREWLPDKWQRVGACETGFGRRPGNWRHSNSSYEGAFGFAKSSWDAFKYRADPKAGPYPEDAWQATPRQQYEVALAIWRAYGFSGWGCRGA